jgi:hypothetical protein
MLVGSERKRERDENSESVRDRREDRESQGRRERGERECVHV